MASAWGNSWGSSWGNSWGVLPAPAPDSGFMPFFGDDPIESPYEYAHRQKLLAQARAEDELLLRVLHNMLEKTECQ